MTAIGLINPNTSRATLESMLAAARTALPDGIELIGEVAARGPAMIVDEAALATAADEVLRIGRALARRCHGIVVAAFGGPGVTALRDVVDIPVVGIGEAAMRAAAARGGRFGVATTTPALAASIERQAKILAGSGQFSGVRVAEGDPLQLAADPALQLERLAAAVARCRDDDRASTVVIGGGPLSAAGRELRDRFGDTIVEPVPEAVGYIVRAIATLRAPMTRG